MGNKYRAEEPSVYWFLSEPVAQSTIVLVTGVFVTRTTRDDAYDGMNVAWAGVDLPLGSYFVYDLSLPSILQVRDKVLFQAFLL